MYRDTNNLREFDEQQLASQEWKEVEGLLFDFVLGKRFISHYSLFILAEQHGLDFDFVKNVMGVLAHDTRTAGALGLFGVPNLGYAISGIEAVEAKKLLSEEIIQNLEAFPEPTTDFDLAKDYVQIWTPEQLPWLSEYHLLAVIWIADQKAAIALTNPQVAFLQTMAKVGYADKVTWYNSGSGYHLSAVFNEVKANLKDVLPDAELPINVDDGGIGLVTQGKTRNDFLTEHFAAYDDRAVVYTHIKQGVRLNYVAVPETNAYLAEEDKNIGFSPRSKAGNSHDVLLAGGMAFEVASVIREIVLLLFFTEQNNVDIHNWIGSYREAIAQYEKLIQELEAAGAIESGMNAVIVQRGSKQLFTPQFLRAV